MRYAIFLLALFSLSCGTPQKLSDREIPDWGRVKALRFFEDSRSFDGGLHELIFTKTADGRYRVESHSKTSGQIGFVHETRELAAQAVLCRNELLDSEGIAMEIRCSGLSENNKEIEFTFKAKPNSYFELRGSYVVSDQEGRPVMFHMNRAVLQFLK